MGKAKTSYRHVKCKRGHFPYRPLRRLEFRGGTECVDGLVGRLARLTATAAAAAAATRRTGEDRIVYVNDVTLDACPTIPLYFSPVSPASLRLLSGPITKHIIVMWSKVQMPLEGFQYSAWMSLFTVNDTTPGAHHPRTSFTWPRRPDHYRSSSQVFQCPLL